MWAHPRKRHSASARQSRGSKPRHPPGASPTDPRHRSPGVSATHPPHSRGMRRELTRWYGGRVPVRTDRPPVLELEGRVQGVEQAGLPGTRGAHQSRRAQARLARKRVHALARLGAHPHHPVAHAAVRPLQLSGPLARARAGPPCSPPVPARRPLASTTARRRSTSEGVGSGSRAATTTSTRSTLAATTLALRPPTPRRTISEVRGSTPSTTQRRLDRATIGPGRR